MSSDAKHEGYVGPNDPAYYAPRELRDRTSSEQPNPMLMQNNDGWRPRVTTEGPSLQPLSKPSRRQDSEMFTKAVAQAMQEARDNVPVEAPSVLRDLSGRRALMQQVIRFSIAVAIAASIAMLLVMAIPSSQRPANQDASLSAAWQSVKSSVLPQQPATPQKRTATLAVQDGSGFVNDPVPLGIHVGAPPPGAFVSISGLVGGARLTSGKRIAANEWRVPATEISGVSVIPPDGYTGQMLVTAELRDGGGVALTGTSTRLTWVASPSAAAPVVAAASPVLAAAPAVAAPPPVVAPPPVAVVAAAPPALPVPAQPQAEVVRSLDPREVAALIRRGQDLLASGDVQSARLFLMRGAEAQNARAALLVGNTYDPAPLRQLGASGLADVAQARMWYQRAKEWGEPDAQRQLDGLAFAR
jgi:hypothetical protein